MEHSVQLGTRNYHDSICSRLQELQAEEALPFQMHEYRQGKHWLIKCDFNIPQTEGNGEQATLTKVHQYYLANALADTIIHNWEQDYLRKNIIKKHRFGKDDVQTVVKKAMDFLNMENGGKNYRVHRKTSLLEQILMCLDNNQTFDVEGFLQFRAQNYKEELERALSYAVDEFVLEKEYLEFIQLLKHFLDNQTCKMDTLHVGISSKGKFHLYNEEGVKVTHQFLDEQTLEEGNAEFSYEDLLISALIAVAPRQVVLHICYDGYQDTLQTIRQVFEDRVSYCSGCHICEKL